MENSENYRKWRQYRKEKHQDQTVAETVMTQIYAYENEKLREAQKMERLITEFDFLQSRLSRIICALGLSALGLFRICYNFSFLVTK